jgi:hypothetical protein
MDTDYNIKGLDYVKAGRLLPQVHDTPSRVEKFLVNDSAKLFSDNLQKQDASWKYRTKEVTYGLNNQSYRAPEWNTIDWENSAVILGCSNVFGIGLAEDETISYQLSLLLNRPVINLGVGASGMSFAMHNSVLLNKNFPTPWAVINLWSDPFRMHEFYKLCIKHYTANSIRVDKNHPFRVDKDQPFQRIWGISEVNPEMHSYFACKATEAIWSSKTKYLSYSHWAPLDSDSIKRLPFIKGDKARDLSHPGAQTAKLSAVTLADALN